MDQERDDYADLDLPPEFPVGREMGAWLLTVLALFAVIVVVYAAGRLFFG